MMERSSDPKLNRYANGTGFDLPDDLDQQPGGSTKSKALKRELFGIFLRNIPIELNNRAILNLCEQYANVHDYKMLDEHGKKCALGFFGSLDDATECMRNINNGPTGIEAELERGKNHNLSLATMDTNEPAPEERNFMMEAYCDPTFNCYDTGPGFDLPKDKQPGALALLKREEFGIFLRNIPRVLSTTGLLNLCEQYGKVKDYKMFDQLGHSKKCALVFFGTLNDAAECMRYINDGSTGIRVEFQKGKKKDGQLPQVSSSDNDHPPIQDDSTYDWRRKVNGPFSKPMNFTSFEPKSLLSTEDYDKSEMLKNCDPHMDFLNVANNSVLAEHLKNKQITNGRANYKHLTEITNKMKNLNEKSQGTLDVEKQEFVHNGGNFISEIGYCRHCSNTAITFCKGCKEFYCSQECWIKTCCKCSDSARESYKASYRGRRDIAGSKESLNGTIKVKMSSRSKILKQLQLKSTIQPCAVPLNNTLVVITAVIDHSQVFLRSMESADNIEYVKFLNDVVECSKSAKPLTKMPVEGDVVLAKFEENYYRALVVRTEEEFAVVVYLEFGNLDKKSLSDLKELRVDLQFKKRFTFKACLSGVKGDLMNDKALAYLYDLVERDIPLKFKNPDRKCCSNGVLCELVQKDSNQNVNIKVAALNCVKVKNNFVANVGTSLSGTNVPVIILNNDILALGCLTVIRKENMQKVLMMQKRISEYSRQDYEGPYTPTKDKICLAKCDDDWYRVQMVESVGDGNPTMIFVDFGNTAQVNVMNMRPMPFAFYYPCYAVFAEIGDIPEQLTAEQIDKLMEYFPVQSTVIVDKCVSKIDDNGSQSSIMYFNDLEL